MELFPLSSFIKDDGSQEVVTFESESHSGFATSPTSGQKRSFRDVEQTQETADTEKKIRAMFNSSLWGASEDGDLTNIIRKDETRTEPWTEGELSKLMKTVKSQKTVRKRARIVWEPIAKELGRPLEECQKEWRDFLARQCDDTPATDKEIDFVRKIVNTPEGRELGGRISWLRIATKVEAEFGKKRTKGFLRKLTRRKEKKTTTNKIKKISPPTISQRITSTKPTVSKPSENQSSGHSIPDSDPMAPLTEKEFDALF